ncbi:hypothetical protein EIP86_003746 [Pleurotus ostreatoroseus]|nr:hypothetical protein EIP86_003746 [Pleurotus ostreatoroseus]
MGYYEHTLFEVQEDAVKVLDMFVGRLRHTATERISQNIGKCALITMVMGMCFGWGLGAAAMRAALAARDQTVLKQSLLREQQSVAGLANPDALFQEDIFQGKFLDTSYGPLFPFGQYTLLNSLLTSVACYIAIGLIAIAFIFPESINHATLVGFSAVIGKLKAVVDLQQKILESSPDDLARGSKLFTQLGGMRVGIIMQIQQMAAPLKFISVEFSWGKWNADDVKALQEPLWAVASRTSALQSFVNVVGHPWTREPYHDAPSTAESSSVSLSTLDSSRTVAVGDTHLLRQLRKRNHSAEAAHAVRITDVLPLIEDVTSELRAACSGALGAVQAVLDNINTRRYNFRKRATYRAEADALVVELDAAVERLRSALTEFSERRRLLLVEPFEPMLQKATEDKGPMPLRSLYIAYVFAANLIVLSESALSLAEVVQATAAKRTRPRLWGPAGLHALYTAITSRSDGDVSEQAAGEDSVPQAAEEVQKEERVFKRDPDSRAPINAVQRFANTVHKLYKWTKTAEALFCFKYVVVTIALWIPAVCRTSAHFIYVEKGLW